MLAGSHLEGADLGEAHLDGAKYDSDTFWPDGFDPETSQAAAISDNMTPSDQGLTGIGANNASSGLGSTSWLSESEGGPT